MIRGKSRFIGLMLLIFMAAPAMADQLTVEEPDYIDAKAIDACLKSDAFRGPLGCIGLQASLCLDLDLGAPNGVKQAAWCNAAEIDYWLARLDISVADLAARLNGKARAEFLAQQAAYETFAANDFPYSLATRPFPYSYWGVGRSLEIVAGRALETDTIESEIQVCLDPESNMRLEELCANVVGAP